MRVSSLLQGAKKLVAITSKRGNKNFYKGRGAPTMGHGNKWGGFEFEKEKIEKHLFIAPDLTGFPLKAYVQPKPRTEKSK